MQGDDEGPRGGMPASAPLGEDAARRLARLTARRRELLEISSEGLTNEQIAGRLGISPATVRTHLSRIYAELGVKNRTEAARLVSEATRSAAPKAIDLFLGRPAIAVLPTTASDSPEPSALAHALTEELGALLARWCWFPVIARSSSERARSLGVGACEVGAALGARFLVDPSLRAGPRGWRLSIEVVDTGDGCVLLTDRVDLGPSPFEALEALAAEIVARTYPVLVARVSGASAVGAAHDASAWQLAHLALRHQQSRDAGGHHQALALCERALALDPTLALAHFARGLCAYDAVLNQWTPALDGRMLLAASADECLRLAPHAAEGYFLLGRYHQTLGDHEAAIGALERGIGNNPSFAAAHALLAQAHMLCGQGELALTRMQHALRLGPRSFVAGLATLHFSAGRFAEAVRGAEEAIAIAPRYPFARAIAAASAYHLGDVARGRAHLEHLRESFPDFDAEGFLTTFGPDVPAVARLSAALRALDEP